MDLEPVRRRRGEDLERAILDAAWGQLADHGYDSFTYEAVAERAGTSRSVLYRRWPERDDLVAATFDHAVRKDRPEIPDTGDLRSDVIELLSSANRTRAQLMPLMSTVMGSYFAQSGPTLAEVRERILGHRPGGAMDIVLARAVERGEVDPARLTPRVRSVAFDLVRHDMLTTMQPLSEGAIVAIVDEVFLPLLGVVPHT